MVTSAVKAGFALAERADQTVHEAQWALPFPNSEQRRFIEQITEVGVILVTDQFQPQLEGCADGFVKFE